MTTTTTSVLTPVPFQFSGLPGLPALEHSWYPRGSISFEDTIAVTAGGASDQLWDIQCTLPSGYAYVLQEVHLALQGATSSLTNWDSSVTCGFGDGVHNVPFDGINTTGGSFVTSTVTIQNWTFPDLPRLIIIATDPAIISVRLSVGNNTIGDAGMTGLVFISCLQYDVEQAHHVRIHTPQLER